MKTYLLLIPIFLILSCKKNEFQSCENYDQLVGRWVGIEEDNLREIIIDSKGYILVKTPLERNIKLVNGSCENKNYTFKNKNIFFRYTASKTGIGFYYNLNFDTIVCPSTIAYNMPDSSLLNYQYYVKK